MRVKSLSMYNCPTGKQRFLDLNESDFGRHSTGRGLHRRVATVITRKRKSNVFRLNSSELMFSSLVRRPDSQELQLDRCQ